MLLNRLFQSTLLTLGTLMLLILSINACGEYTPTQTRSISTHSVQPNYETVSPSEVTYEPAQQEMELRESSPNNLPMDGIHAVNGWQQKLPIPYQIDHSLSISQKSQIKAAMNTWANALCMDFDEMFVKAEYNQVLSKNSQLYSTLHDQIFTQYFDKDFTLNTLKDTEVLATAVWENSAQDLQTITAADIRYNTETYTFGDALNKREVKNSDPSKIFVDLESVSLHEIGHILGLSHVDAYEDPFSIMAASSEVGPGKARRALSTQDILKARTIFNRSCF